MRKSKETTNMLIMLQVGVFAFFSLEILRTISWLHFCCYFRQFSVSLTFSHVVLLQSNESFSSINLFSVNLSKQLERPIYALRLCVESRTQDTYQFCCYFWMNWSIILRKKNWTYFSWNREKVRSFTLGEMYWVNVDVNTWTAKIEFANCWSQVILWKHSIAEQSIK